MKRVGAHVHITGGVQNAPILAQEIGAKAFALFTKNQRQWQAKPYDDQTILEFKENLKKAGYAPEHVLAHDTYLINLGSPDPDNSKRSLNAFIDELRRCRQLGIRLLNIHPGNHLNAVSEERCLELIAEAINRALEQTSEVTVVLENTSGQGSSVGYRFEHLAQIVHRVEDKSRIGVCFDTCHGFAAGYDLRTERACSATFAEFERTIGLPFLRGLHLNDSVGDLSSKKDRHKSLGKGTIGLEAFRYIMNDNRFDEMPLVLETDDESLWPEEIEMLYSFVKTSPAGGKGKTKRGTKR
jgi:deoxyribonuclease-4